ncbi:MAG: hypothetical protein E7665_07825 [Ruminococcaceae bacterium]|nr:hypothetical protein [Oscillospiraceae bacterium]
MKKIILLLLTFSLILSLFSCTTPPETRYSSELNTTETEEIKYSEESEKGYLIVLLKNGLLHKLYPEEGVVVPLCPDPLCKHNTQSCPFFQSAPSICEQGNLIYYLRKGSSKAYYQSICKFDLNTGKYEVLFESKDYTMSKLYATEDYLFFQAMNFKANEATGYKLMRYEISTKKVVELMSEYVIGDLTLITHNDERLYWLKDETYYSTDYDFQNKRENDKGYHSNLSTGKYSFSVEIGDMFTNEAGSFLTRSIKSINRETGEEKVIVEATGNLMLAYKGKLIYTLPDEATFIGYRIIDSNPRPRKIYDLCGNKFYICNADGSDAKLLCDISGNNCTIDIGPTSVGGKYGVGDLVVWPLWYYETVDEEKQIVDRREKNLRVDYPDKFAVINYKTGEFKIIDTL